MLCHCITYNIYSEHKRNIHTYIAISSSLSIYVDLVCVHCPHWIVRGSIAAHHPISLSTPCLQVLGREKLPGKRRQRKTTSTHQPTTPKVPFFTQMHVHLAINHRWVLFSCALYLFIFLGLLFYLGRWGSANYSCFVLLWLGICSCDSLWLG